MYEKAGDNLKQFIREEVFIQDEEPALYIYELTMQGRTQSGLVVCTSIDEYEDDTIKNMKEHVMKKRVRSYSPRRCV